MKYLLILSIFSFLYYVNSQYYSRPKTNVDAYQVPEKEVYSNNPTYTSEPEPEQWSNTGYEEEEEAEYGTEDEVYLPPIEFINGEESIIECLQVDGQTYWERMILNDVSVSQLETDLNNANNAALKDRALSNFIKDKLGSEPNSSDNQVINLGKNPIEPQAQNIQVANVERIVIASNWTGVDTSSNVQNVDIPASLDASSLNLILNTGSVLAISQGIEASLLTSRPYIVTAVNSVSRQDTRYEVSLQLRNSQDLNVDVSFIMSYLPSRNAWKVSSFSYQFLQSNSQDLVKVAWTNNTGDYTITTNTDSVVLNEAQYLGLGGYKRILNVTNYPQYDKLKYLMIAGINWVASQGIKSGALIDSIYDVAQIHSVYTRQDSSGNDVLFKYDIDIADTTGKGARISFEVFYALETQVQAYGFYYSI